MLLKKNKSNDDNLTLIFVSTENDREKNNHKSTKLINVYMCFFSHMGGCMPVQIAYANDE